MQEGGARMQVSDREHLVSRDAEHTAEQLAEATEMLDRGEGEEILYRDSGTGRSALPDFWRLCPALPWRGTAPTALFFAAPPNARNHMTI